MSNPINLNEWRKWLLSKISDVIDVMAFSIFFVLNFMMWVVVFAIFSSFGVIKLINTPPIQLVEWILILAILVLAFIFIIFENKLERIWRRIGAFGWKLASAETEPDDGSSSKPTYIRKKNHFLDESVDKVPLFILLLIFPIIIISLLTEEFGSSALSALSALYLLISIIIGSTQSAYNRRVAVTRQLEQLEKEVSEIIISQVESSLLIIGTILQLIVVANIHINDFPKIIFSLLFTFLLMLPIISVWAKDGT
jgi:hypothetical protein